MTPADLLAAYERVVAASEHMLAAAEQSHWDELIALEIDRREMIGQLAAQPGPTLTDEEQTRKRALITRTLELDERVRTLTRAWMDETQVILTSLQAQRKLNKAYHPG